jgi:hypothetical protein
MRGSSSGMLEYVSVELLWVMDAGDLGYHNVNEI